MIEETTSVDGKDVRREHREAHGRHDCRQRQHNWHRSRDERSERQDQDQQCHGQRDELGPLQIVFVDLADGVIERRAAGVAEHQIGVGRCGVVDNRSDVGRRLLGLGRFLVCLIRDGKLRLHQDRRPVL